MISEKILSFLSKVPEKVSLNASGIILNILFILIIILTIWGIFKIIDKYDDCESPVLSLLYIIIFIIGFIFIFILIIDIVIVLSK